MDTKDEDIIAMGIVKGGVGLMLLGIVVGGLAFWFFLL